MICLSVVLLGSSGRTHVVAESTDTLLLPLGPIGSSPQKPIWKILIKTSLCYNVSISGLAMLLHRVLLDVDSEVSTCLTLSILMVGALSFDDLSCVLDAHHRPLGNRPSASIVVCTSFGCNPLA